MRLYRCRTCKTVKAFTNADLGYKVHESFEAPRSLEKVCEGCSDTRAFELIVIDIDTSQP